MRHSRVPAFLSMLLSLIIIGSVVKRTHAGSIPVSAPFSKSVTTRQTANGDGHGGKGYLVKPLLDETPPATAIIIHGLGGTGEEWGVLSLGMSVFSLNYVKFVIPSADVRKVTYLDEQIPSWFDIERIQGVNSVINEQQLSQSVERINNIIDGEIKAGVPSERIFIVGFSQGGALALTTFLRSKKRLGGCVGVATWLPLSEANVRVSNNIKGTKILMIHGTKDEAVDFQYGQLSAQRIESFGVRVNFTVIEDAPHVILSADVIRMIEDYIAERATGTRNFLRTLVSDLTATFGSLSSRLKEPKFVPIP